MLNFKQWPADRRGLYLLLFVSLFIKVIMVACSDVVNDDGILYILAAQEFAEGNFKEGLSLYPMPFYPLLVVISHWFIPQWILAGQTISLLALGLAAIPLYMTTRLLFGPKPAFWGGMIFAVSPWFNYLAADVIRDPVFLFFFLFALYFGSCAITLKRTRDYILTSVFCILAFLCRVEAIFFPFLFLIVLAVIAARDRDCNDLKGIMGFLIIPLVIITISYVFMKNEIFTLNRFHEIFGYFNFDFIQSYRNVYEHISNLEETVQGMSKSRNFSEIARHNLWLIYLIGLFQGIFKILFPIMVFPLLAGFAGVRWNRGHFLLLSLTAAYVTGCYVFHMKMNFIDTRYLIVPAILFLPWIGAGISKFFNRARHAGRPKIAAVALILFFVLVPFGKSMEVMWRGGDHAIKQASLWLAQQPGLNTLSMISTDGRIPFYSGHRKNYKVFSNNDYQKMEQVAVNGDFELMVITASKKELTEPLTFTHFEMWKMYESYKNVAFIYRKKS